ncbi:MAG TPA: hypothetical protein VN577_14110 [Terriglobales bacterium]|nr:hypothetical protein [Terriglobales bacterium]
MNYDSDLIRFFLLSAEIPYAIMIYVLIRRKLYREVSWFTIYLMTQFAHRPVAFYYYQIGDKWGYFYSAWFGSLVGMSTSLLAIIEIFRVLMNDYPEIKRTGTRIFIIAMIGTFLISLALVPMYIQIDHALMRALFTFQRSIRFAQVGLIVAVFALSSYLGITWRHYLFGITMGLGLYAASDLAGTVYAAHEGPIVAWKTLLLDQVAYTLVLISWTVYLLQPTPAPTRVISQEHQADLERWDRALKGLASNG